MVQQTLKRLLFCETEKTDSPSEVANEYTEVEETVRNHATKLVDKGKAHVTIDWKYDA